MADDKKPILPVEGVDFEADQGAEEYVEEYVDIVDNRRRVILLAVALLVLLLVLGVLGWYLWGSLRPVGAPSGEVTKGMVWVRSLYAWGEKPEDRLVAPIAVAVAPDGTYWTVSNHTTMVGFEQNGRLAGIINLPQGEGPGQIQSIEGIAFDSNGNLFVADYGNAKVLKVLPGGKVDGEVLVTFPQKVAVGGDRLGVGSVRGVAVFGLDRGELLAKWGARGDRLEEFDSVRGLAFGEDGTVFTTDSLNRRVKAYSPSGRLLWSFPDTETVDTAKKLDELNTEDRGKVAAEIPFELPQGLTVDAAGRVVLVDAFKSRISVQDPRDGTVLGTYGRDGANDGTFVYPTDIAYDATRDQFVVADTGNNRLQVVRIEGSGGGPAALAGRLQGQPWWVCCFPLLLLLSLLVMAVVRSRRKRDQLTADPADSSHT